MRHAGHKVTVRWIQTRTGEWVLYHFTHTFISLFIYSFFFLFSPYTQYIILTSHCIYMHRYFAMIQNMSVFSVWCEWWKYPSLIGFLCFWVWHWVSNYTVGYDILSETFNSAYSFKQKSKKQARGQNILFVTCHHSLETVNLKWCFIDKSKKPLTQ